ncbi:carbohydrate ABC transporter permease [Intrasporangium calvum]|uniref:Carbohydrate ABC transporter membrane protein 1, CUT1 family n=1 Tax=Intrasporangium calvum (strain ATCC 23552 / DSM 43043 / JCM 3097 / NBRC 12989 / NCIMB 10167 / NRRL B-3866 / 7 KIP) TaxID=710696 RepID=E6SEN6_INTC7|nr:sugar ABC transporter permease [Intrasporangium calvum]ADU46637.1 carbohydrate ABC transporter membrane protein 1, CUT1 family [Intrasporangium calvum DSM 43043]AXG15007.1 sugar ABC transporter permease [Intrasporangium calvum]
MRTATKVRDWLPGFLLVLPSVIVVGIFVYWLILQNVLTSLDRTVTRATKRVTNPGGVENYTNLLGDDGYQHALFNLLVLTVVFVAGTMVFGLLWAVLLEKGVNAEGVFRSVYLLPMAISFIAAGIVWRWLLSPGKGEQAVGLNQLLAMMGLERFQSSWWQSPNTLSMAAMAIPAIWQLSGYVMALFLAGFRGISDDQREAARIDGATERQIYRHVLFPQLSPIALSALIIIGHMSMKMFDLIYAIAGQNSYKASVPATLMWTQMFQQNNPTAAAANATILLVLVALVVVPYLIYTNKTEKETRG